MYGSMLHKHPKHIMVLTSQMLNATRCNGSTSEVLDLLCEGGGPLSWISLW